MSRPARGLRAWARIGVLAVALIGLVGGIFTTVTFRAFLDARTRLSAELTPANVAAQRMLGALLDQETGVRGFALSGDATFLEPYRSGQDLAETTAGELRDRLRNHPPTIDLVDRFVATAASWQEDTAEPLIALTEANGGGAVTDEELRAARASFNEVRADALVLQERIDRDRQAALVDLDARTRRLAFTLVAVAVFLTAGVATSYLVLRSAVLAPVERLGVDARLVAGGDLHHEVTGTGPGELQQLAADMEAMRVRILEELAGVERARVLLEGQAHDLERSNQELEQFAYVASHDLQEPLRKISGFCQLLERRYAGQLDDRADEYIGFAVDGAKRMQLLINDLLTFSRVGRTTAAFVPVDLGQVATEVVGTLSGPIAEAGATIEVGDLPTVQGDAALLESLLQNLVTNAVKFRGDRPPTIRLGAERVGDEWHLACEDDGIGIEPEFVDRVFVIFQRLHNREAYEGTGIGLAMCRKIVEFHGGRMWIDAEGVGPGTIVRWTLPVEAELAAHPTSPGDQP